MNQIKWCKDCGTAIYPGPECPLCEMMVDMYRDIYLSTPVVPINKIWVEPCADIVGEEAAGIGDA